MIGEVVFPGCTEFLYRLSGQFFPCGFVVPTLPDGGIQFGNKMLVLVLADPVQEIGRNAITAVVTRTRVVTTADIRAVFFRFKEVK